MRQDTLYVGLDTDKKHVDVALADSLPGGEVRYWGQMANKVGSVERLVRRLCAGGREVIVCYEAGPCGYGISRRLNAIAGVRCEVVAPSLIPRRPGDRVKTNRRDALNLVRLLRAGELTAVWMPDETHEAMRDLVRARTSSVEDMGRFRQRIGGFLLRHEIGYAGKPWSKKHRAWLGGLEFAEPAHRLMFAEALGALDQAVARRDRLGDCIAELVPGWSLGWLVEALRHLRGFALINAAVLAVEIGDPRRFENPRQLMAFLGLVPSEHSTGESIRRGGLTKTGNKRGRKCLIEAAWTYSRPARRVEPGANPALDAVADKARHRLSRRYRILVRNGKRTPVACAAVARELAGFVWAAAHAAAPKR
ncbi:MAG: IS110 family transposase [Alphaproteobacteria bacterium]